MKVEVSIGEAVDKLSILELKMKKITNENKKIEIQKEINVLSECEEYKSKYDFYYSLLMYVNEKIWDMTDVIKSITVDDSQFSHISNQIFEFNQKRFRIKNWFNLLTVSNIKEQKSYSSSHCKIIVDNEDVFFDKLAEINYLSIEYDVLTFESPIISTVKDFLKIPTVIYDEEQIKLLNTPTIICLTDFFIPTSVSIEVFSQKPIVYICGGFLGDFIHSLSVICENFYETGRKGILYISNHREAFKYGIEYTYNDVYSVIINQKYIQDFKIYDNEPFEVDLSLWRDSNLLYKQNLYYIYKNTYNIEWGKRKWLDTIYDDKWIDKIIINTTSYRFPFNIDFDLLYKLYSVNLIFISFNKNEYDYFEQNTKLSIEYYEFKDFLDLTTIINSCKLFIGSLSAPLSIAHALHKPRICGLTNIGNNALDNIHNLELDTYLPNITYCV
jgi:hypothetical protein